MVWGWKRPSKRARRLPATMWNPATITLLACSAVLLFFSIQPTYHDRQGTRGCQSPIVWLTLNLLPFTQPLTLSCWCEPEKNQRHHGSSKYTGGTHNGQNWKRINQHWRKVRKPSTKFLWVIGWEWMGALAIKPLGPEKLVETPTNRAHALTLHASERQKGLSLTTLQSVSRIIWDPWRLESS